MWTTNHLVQSVHQRARVPSSLLRRSGFQRGQLEHVLCPVADRLFHERHVCDQKLPFPLGGRATSQLHSLQVKTIVHHYTSVTSFGSVILMIATPSLGSGAISSPGTLLQAHGRGSRQSSTPITHCKQLPNILAERRIAVANSPDPPGAHGAPEAQRVPEPLPRFSEVRVVHCLKPAAMSSALAIAAHLTWTRN